MLLEHGPEWLCSLTAGGFADAAGVTPVCRWSMVPEWLCSLIGAGFVLPRAGSLGVGESSFQWVCFLTHEGFAECEVGATGYVARAHWAVLASFRQGRHARDVSARPGGDTAVCLSKICPGEPGRPERFCPPKAKAGIAGQIGWIQSLPWAHKVFRTDCWDVIESTGAGIGKAAVTAFYSPRAGS